MTPTFYDVDPFDTGQTLPDLWEQLEQQEQTRAARRAAAAEEAERIHREWRERMAVSDHWAAVRSVAMGYGSVQVQVCATCAQKWPCEWAQVAS